LLSGLSPVRESGLNKHLRHKPERVCIDGAFGVDSLRQRENCLSIPSSLVTRRLFRRSLFLKELSRTLSTSRLSGALFALAVNFQRRKRRFKAVLKSGVV
jgi:hypothetical protein